VSSTKADRVREAVLADIASGALGPGAPLDEAILAQQHSVSRTPVREALRRLQSDGLLETGPRRQLLVVDVSPAHRREITTLRVALEGAAASAACEVRDEDDLDRLELLLLKQRRAAQANDPEVFLQLDEEFHLALAGAARLPTLSRMLGQLGRSSGSAGWANPPRSGTCSGSSVSTRSWSPSSGPVMPPGSAPTWPPTSSRPNPAPDARPTSCPARTASASELSVRGTKSIPVGANAARRRDLSGIFFHSGPIDCT
jgi:DNA-binding GntR family transcriptional regulator